MAKELITTVFAHAFMQADLSGASKEMLDVISKSGKRHGQKEVNGWNANLSFRTAGELKKQEIL